MDGRRRPYRRRIQSRPHLLPIPRFPIQPNGCLAIAPCNVPIHLHRPPRLHGLYFNELRRLPSFTTINRRPFLRREKEATEGLSPGDVGGHNDKNA